MNKLFEWIKKSFDNSPGGASSKKLTGFWFVVGLTTPTVLTWLIWAFTHDDWSHLIPVLMIITPAGLTALGINAWEKSKNLNKDAND